MTPLDLNPALAEQALTAQSALAAALAREFCAPLTELVARDPDAASAGLSAAILRIVFLLHAEDRGLLGASPARPVSALLDRRRSPAFFGYRTLHGLFIHRAATLLRPGGRLGLIVPTSVSDLQGYFRDVISPSSSRIAQALLAQVHNAPWHL